MLFLSLLGLVARLRVRLGRILLGRQILRVLRAAKELVEERERCRLAVLLVVLCTVLLRICHHAEAAERLGHFTAEAFKIIIRDAHALHQVIDRLDAKLARTFEAQALVDGFAVIDFCNKDHRKIFLATGT